MTLCLRRDQSLERPSGIKSLKNVKDRASVSCLCFTRTFLRTASKTDVNQSHKHKQPRRGQGRLYGNVAFLPSLSSESSHSWSKTFWGWKGKRNAFSSQLTNKLLQRFFNGLKKCDFGIDEACKWSLGLLCWLKKQVLTSPPVIPVQLVHNLAWSWRRVEIVPSSDSLNEAVFIGSLALHSLRI